MSDDPPGRNDPLMSVSSTETPVLSEEDTGSKWFALLFLGFGLLVSLFGFALMVGGGL
jgi:hypothetical protein